MSKKNSTNFWLDLIIFGIFLIVASPSLTGNTIHEWLSLAFGATIIVHLLFHWKWIVKVLRKFFKKILSMSRLNMIVDMLFLITMTGSFFSGILISKDVISTLGIHFSEVSRNWKMIHVFTSDVAVILLAVHLALHWKWVVSTINKSFVQPVKSRLQSKSQAALAVQPVRIDKE